ncbi:hypothetical protein GWK47_035001 [Chionoecetes opilio]|uniref:Uncharacterized protein n=1 Tax=Chionoecetes opilio TaxID=41210 RepID=A0A8J4YUH2_CHIOP|nr:hypothetical protein GWK47_035001 [Chionoecetes opilio]
MVKTYFLCPSHPPVIDYSAPCLPGLKQCLLSSLEVAQNEGPAHDLQSTTWTRLHTLPDAHMQLARTGRPDLPHPDFASPLLGSPNQFPSSAPVLQNPRLPSLLYLDKKALRPYMPFSPPGTTTYLTDGSVSEYGAAGALCVWRTRPSVASPDGVSAFQPELTAIQCALEMQGIYVTVPQHLHRLALIKFGGTRSPLLQGQRITLVINLPYFQSLVAHNNTITLTGPRGM